MLLPSTCDESRSNIESVDDRTTLFLNYNGFFLKIPTKCGSKYIKQMYNCAEFGLILQQILIL